MRLFFLYLRTVTLSTAFLFPPPWLSPSSFCQASRLHSHAPYAHLARQLSSSSRAIGTQYHTMCPCSTSPVCGQPTGKPHLLHVLPSPAEDSKGMELLRCSAEKSLELSLVAHSLFPFSILREQSNNIRRFLNMTRFTMNSFTSLRVLFSSILNAFVVYDESEITSNGILNHGNGILGYIIFCFMAVISMLHIEFCWVAQFAYLFDKQKCNLVSIESVL